MSVPLALGGYNPVMQLSGVGTARSRARGRLDDVMPTEQLSKLMHQVRAQDQAAFALLYDATVAKVFALARCLLRNKADAEDLVCDVYEQAWQQADRFDASRGNVLAWLLTMCRSRCLDLLRQRQVRATHADREREREETTKNYDDSPDYLLQQLQSGTAIHDALCRLPAVRRQMIALAFFQDLSHQEIAARLAMPLGTVKSHVRRALAELHEALTLQEARHG